MEKELKYLGKALQHPEAAVRRDSRRRQGQRQDWRDPNLMDKVNSLIIGGGMAYTFLKAQGQEIGKSLLEADKVDLAQGTAGGSEEAQSEIPASHRSCGRHEAGANAVVQQIGEGQPIPADKMALDIGPKTIELFSEEISTRPHDCMERTHGRVRNSWILSRARSRSRRRSPTMAARFRSWAAAIRSPPCRPPMWPTRSRTSPRAAARRWSSWKDKKLPGVEALDGQEVNRTRSLAWLQYSDGLK